MAITQIFPLTLIDSVKTSAAKNWPAGKDRVTIILNDAVFTDPAESVMIEIQLSYDGGATWPYTDTNVWVGGAKSRDGSSPHTILGPFIVGGVTQIPTKVRFRASPVAGTPTVGLTGDAE